MLIIIKIVCQFFQSTSRQVTIQCDNLELGGHAVLSLKTPPSLPDDHFDIISAIFKIKQRLPVKLIYQHIEGD
jgi:hypothetical protein